MSVKRGDIYYVLFDNARGSEQSGIRPGVIINKNDKTEYEKALVIQNNVGNKYSPTIIVAPITSQKKSQLPTHVTLDTTEQNGLSEQSMVLLEQVRTFDFNERFNQKIGSLSKSEMEKIDNALAISLGLNNKKWGN